MMKLDIFHRYEQKGLLIIIMKKGSGGSVFNCYLKCLATEIANKLLPNVWLMCLVTAGCH